MPDIDFLKLNADAAGLRIIVLANQLGCESDRERALHDWVEKLLTNFIAFTQSALEAERRLVLNTDPTKVAEIGEDLCNHRDNYQDYWCEEGDSDLWNFVPYGMAEFRNILSRIHRDLRIFLTAWGLELHKDERPVSAKPRYAFNADDIDDECYEDLHGTDDGE
ncbi:hypothetical protein [Rhizobium rhizogenes]|jgi:hypothetical protein|uniref:hypothetical protein n=1 Tax=Rhizobium rhizogenes TaxID=359 RepID=UPI000648414C|nr:hypothetical protein [Rhizobium rhizogenes]